MKNFSLLVRCEPAAAIMLGEFISPCGVVWCSFRPDAVVAEPVHLLPHGEMLLVGARRDLGIEIASPAAETACAGRP